MERSKLYQLRHLKVKLLNPKIGVQLAGKYYYYIRREI